jgi:hypothetical protein
MALPTRAGVYRDHRNDLWVQDARGYWMHAARRTEAAMTPVLGRFTGWISREAFATNPDPGAEVLPVAWVEADDVPPWLREELPHLIDGSGYVPAANLE